MPRGVSRPPPSPPAAPIPKKSGRVRRGTRASSSDKRAKATRAVANPTTAEFHPKNAVRTSSHQRSVTRVTDGANGNEVSAAPYIHVAAAQVQKVGLTSTRPGAEPTRAIDDDVPAFLRAQAPSEWKATLSRRDRAKLSKAQRGPRENDAVHARLADAARQLAGTATAAHGRSPSGSRGNTPMHRPADLQQQQRKAAGGSPRNGPAPSPGSSSSSAGFGMAGRWSSDLDTLLRALLVQITPLERERVARRSILDRVDRILKRAGGLVVGVYGSARTGVILPDSDLDLCATRATATTGPGGFTVNRPPQPRKSGYSNPDFVNVLRELRRGHGGFCNVVPVAHARVPILKFQDRASGIDVDISFTRDGVTTSDYLAAEFSRPRFELARPLVVLVKLLLRRWNLHDPKEGGVGSFVVSLMVLWYLTVLNEGHWTLPDDHPQSPKTAGRLRTPQLAVPTGSQPADGGEFDEVNEHMTNAPGRLAPLLVGFLQYYGELFPFKTTGVDLARGATFEKAASSELHFVNPTLSGHNVAAAASSFGVSVRPRFAAAARQLAGLPPKTRVSKGPNAAAASPDAAARSLFGDLGLNRWSEEGYRQFKLQRRAEQEAAAARRRQRRDSDDDSSDSYDDGWHEDAEARGESDSDDDDASQTAESSSDTAPRRPVARDDDDASESSESDVFFSNVIVRSPHMGPSAAPPTHSTGAGKKSARHHRMRRGRPKRFTRHEH